MRNRYFHNSPLVPAVMAVMAGIFIAHALRPGVLSAAVVVLLSTLCSVLLRRWRTAVTAGVLVALAGFGALLYMVKDAGNRVMLPSGSAVYEAVVADEPVDKGRTLRTDLQLCSGPLAGRTVRASLQKDSAAADFSMPVPGEGMVVTMRLQAPRNYGVSNFDYVTYLKGRNIIATAYVRRGQWRPRSVRLSSLSVFSRARLQALAFRHRLSDRFRAIGLTGQDHAVVAAMALGDKSGLSTDVRDAYSTAGTSHVLALSGLHLSIIYSLLSFFSLGHRLRTLRELLLLTAIWSYVFMVGMSPSVMRSALMLSLYSLAGMAGRDRVSMAALSFAAMVLLLLNPFTLFDIGFQLSFISVAFILLYNGRFSSFVSRPWQQAHPVAAWFWQTISMSVVAQLGTFPLVAYYFGQISVYFLPANLIVIPAATVILYASVGVIVSAPLPFLQSFVLYLLALVVSIVNRCVLFISSLPGAAVTGVHLSLPQLLILYVLVFITLHTLFFVKRSYDFRHLNQ